MTKTSRLLEGRVMGRTKAKVVVLIVLLSGSASLVAQTSSPEDCLEGTAAHPAVSETQRDRCLEADEALSVASPAEVKSQLQTLLKYTQSGNKTQVKSYATMFLMAIAMRPDGADLLSSDAANISSLIVDADPGIQKVAVAITDWIISKPQTNKEPYRAALLAAVQKQQTPQDVLVEMIVPLLSYSSSDPDAVKSVLDFLHRADLTESTRMEIVHSLAGYRDFPIGVRKLLVGMLDDPSLRVRAAAVIAFSNSYSGYDPLARDRVRGIAGDEHENPRLRALAKEALAGHSPLNPNIDLTPYKPTGVNY